MVENQTTINQVRQIDNSRHWLPFLTTLLLFFLIFLFIWFFRGGSFRLYASLFFTIYSITQQIWLSVILMGILQNILFLPLRIIGSHFHQSLKAFEDELERTESSEDQYFLVSDKNKIATSLQEGSLPIVFYIFNFFVNAIAFFSAGRIFLIDFYTDPLKLHKMNLLYKFIPYPQYPLQGTHLNLRLFEITQTTSVPWNFIIWTIVGLILIPTLLRFIWRLVRFIFKRSQNILQARIQYNQFLLKLSGFSLVGAIAIIFILRHLPSAIRWFIFAIDLSQQNTPMNFTTAVGTFIVTIHSGYKSNKEASHEALKSGIPQDVVKKVSKDNMRQSFKNAVVLGLGAFFITNNIPSAFELSVTTFEVMYMIYPYTFGIILKKAGAIQEITKDDD
jgi:hypothetical protein